MVTKVDAVVGQDRCIRVDRGYLEYDTTNNSPHQLHRGEETFATANSDTEDTTSPRNNAQWVSVLVLEDGFVLEPTKDVATFENQDCSLAPPPQFGVGDDFAGSMTALLYPGYSKLLLDMANGKISGQTRSFTIERKHQKNITNEAVFRYRGVKVGSYTLSASEDTGAFQMEANLVCKTRDYNANFQSDLSPATQIVDFPTVSPYLFKNGFFRVQLDTTGTPAGLADHFIEGDISSFSINVENNLDIGPKKRDFGAGAPPTGGDWQGAPEFINSGRQTITGQLTVKLRYIDWYTHQRDFKNFAISLIGVHPGANRMVLDAAAAKGATTLTVVALNLEGSSHNIEETEFIVIEGARDTTESPNTSANNLVECHQVDTSASSGTTLVIESPGILDEAGFVTASDVWTRGIEIYLPQCKVTNVTPAGAPTESVTLTVNFSAEKSTAQASLDRFMFSGSEALQYQCEDDFISEAYVNKVMGLAGD